MGINLDELKFHPITDAQHDLGVSVDQQAPRERQQDDGSLTPFSMADAKVRLAAYYSLPTEAIETVIRG